MHNINQSYTNANIGWKNVLSNKGKLALKGHIDYIQFTNHPLWKAAVKASAWTLVQKSNALSCFNTDNGPGEIWHLN